MAARLTRRFATWITALGLQAAESCKARRIVATLAVAAGLWLQVAPRLSRPCSQCADEHTTAAAAQRRPAPQLRPPVPRALTARKQCSEAATASVAGAHGIQPLKAGCGGRG